jgi:hypothetical protein
MDANVLKQGNFVIEEMVISLFLKSHEAGSVPTILYLLLFL